MYGMYGMYDGCNYDICDVGDVMMHVMMMYVM